MCRFARFVIDAALVQGDPMGRQLAEVGDFGRCLTSFRSELDLRFAPNQDAERVDCIASRGPAVLALPDEQGPPPYVKARGLVSFEGQDYLVSDLLETDEGARRFFSNNTWWVNPVAYLIETGTEGDVSLSLHGAIARAYDDEGFVLYVLTQSRLLARDIPVRDLPNRY